MKVGTKEWHEIVVNFERNYRYERLDKEPEELWKQGSVYQDGTINALYNAYLLGYSLGRLQYMHEEAKEE